MEKINLEVVMEIVICFPSEGFMIVQVNSGKLLETQDIIRNSVLRYLKDKTPEYVMIDGICGKCDFRSDLVCGMYVRPAHKTTTEDFQKKVIELTKRQVEASEKMVSEHDGGDSWKKES